jgi:acyl-CoA thioesterase I
MRRLLLIAILLLGLASPATAKTLRIVMLGDSLAAGYGLDPGEAFPVKLEAALKAKGHDVQIINAGVSGDTSTGGADRIDWVLGDNPDAVIVELGGNDALRGISPPQTAIALEKIMAAIAARKLPALLAGMKAPRNLGADYVEAFDAIYPKLAEKHGVLFYPFFLEGVAADPRLNQPDGIHPNEAGVALIVERITPKVEELIARLSGN